MGEILGEILGDILGEILGEILRENPWGNPWEACVEADQTQEDFGGREGVVASVSTQSQGRGHGEAGGLQYQTPNSEMEELFGEEELG